MQLDRQMLDIVGSIEVIADHRMPDGSKVHTNLMSAACFELCPKQGASIQTVQHLKLGRCFASLTIYAHANAVGRIPSEGGLDAELRIVKIALSHANVSTLRRFGLDLGGQESVS